MGRIGDFFNKIKNSIFRKNIPKLEEPKKDLFLEAELKSGAMELFENPNNYNEYCQEFFKNEENFKNQYNYVDLISQMKENGYMDEYKNYLKYVNENSNLYFPSQVHGIDHTSRVLLFAEMLCMLDNLDPHDKNLIMVAAQLHDIGREDDAKNFDHGFSGRRKIEDYGLLKNFSPRDAEIIKFAVESHSLEPDQIETKLSYIPEKDRGDFKKVLDYLQDADKLDRTRIANKGWGLDPNRLASNTAKRLVKVAHQNFFEYHNVMNYENKIDFKDSMGNKLIEDFMAIRNKGYNITIDDFYSIVSEYKPGTLEMLRTEGRLEDIFSFETFNKYRKPESFEDRLKADRVDPNTIYEEVTSRSQISLLKKTFDNDFMLYYNLKKNHREAYELLCYTDTDKNIRYLAGVATEIQLSDLDRLSSNGCHFRMNDLMLLASNVTPEQYHDIIHSGNIEELYNSKYATEYDRERLEDILRKNNIVFNKQTFEQNFRLIEGIASNFVGIFKEPESQKYSLPEIFAAVTKIADAKYRIKDGKHDHFDYDSKLILDLLEYSRKVDFFKKVGEDEQIDFIEQIATNSDLLKDVRFVDYMVKRNKPYETNNPQEILNYQEYCADKILLDDKIGLDEAKSKFINSLFDIDVPPNNKKDFEKEILETLYYHKKYIPNSKLQTTYGIVLDGINEVLESSNIKEFKNVLYKNKHFINCYNTNTIGKKMKSELMEFSKNDISRRLQETSSQIDGMPTYNVLATNGKSVSVKIFSGQEFYLATSTSMPKCSSHSTALMKNDPDNTRKNVYNEMLNTDVFNTDVCASIISNEMVAHAASFLQDQELKFGYVPNSQEQISIAGMHDLSSSKKGGNRRSTEKETNYRSIKDFVSGTTEEHNEVVMNTHPKYIICHDKVTDVAIEKRRTLQEQYKQMGISENVEIILIDTKSVYIPQIKQKLQREHSDIRNKLENGNFTLGDFQNMFEKHESNFVLRTLQAMHSTSYRNDAWDDKYNEDILKSMTDILEKVSEIVPPQKSRVVLDQVDIILDRADKSTEYGKRFYDHSYAHNIDTEKLRGVRGKLYKKVIPYEKGIEPNLTEPVYSNR